MLKGKLREFILILVIVLVGFAATLVNRNFLTIDNISNIFNIVSTMGIMAVGATLVIATGNIDASVGAQFYALSMLCATLVKLWDGENGALIFLISMAGGILLGLINGVLVAMLKIPAIVVTLAMLSALRGVVLLLTDGAMITGLVGKYVSIAVFKIGPLYITPIIWIIVTLITYVMLYKMRFGREILAMGGNSTAAVRIGISQKKIYTFVFVYAGFLVGVASALYTSKVGTIQSVLGTGYEMKLIAAVVIGGTAFSGGITSLLGTFCGVLLLGTIDNMLVMMRVPTYWQAMTIGTILLIAVISSAFKQSSKVRGKRDTICENPKVEV